MQKLSLVAQADEYAALAAGAQTAEQRDMFLSMEAAMRKLADAQRRVENVRARNGSTVGEATPPLIGRPHPPRRLRAETA